MKYVIRKGVFETNSSSDHALIFSDCYPKACEDEFDIIYETTNDAYKKLCYALAFLIGSDLKTDNRLKIVKLKSAFIAYYCKKYQKNFEEIENRLIADIKEIHTNYYSSIDVGNTCLQPLFDTFWFTNKKPDEKLGLLPSDEELKKILIKYFHKRSFIVIAQDQLF